MARNKEFEPDEALESAMFTFWNHGFDATSTQALERDLGINRSSMYATFGTKAELYRKALELYMEGGEGWGPVRPGALDGTAPLKERVSKLLWLAVASDFHAHRQRGCFACNAAVELGPRDETIRAMVAKSFGQARMVFKDALMVARSSGDLRPDADIDALASLLLCTLEGLHVLAKGTGDRRLIKQSIAGAVAAL